MPPTCASARSIYQRCTDLFTAYREAVTSTASLVIMVKDEGGPHFWILAREDSEFHLFPWRRQGLAVITAGTPASSVPAGYTAPLFDGIPLPPDGSLYGWHEGGSGIITALVQFSVRYSPDNPVPSFGVLLPAGAPARCLDQPPASQRLFGTWFWDALRCGRVIPVGEAISAASGQVFWSGTVAPEGYGVIGVTHPLTVRSASRLLPGEATLLEGVYAPAVVLAGGARPTLEKILADPGKTDLAPRFRAGRDQD